MSETAERRRIIVPQPLHDGSHIVMLSPAGRARVQHIDRALEALRYQRWNPSLAKHTLENFGSYSSTPENRFSDLRDALLDRNVDAIICTRGGYGAVHLLEQLDRLPLRDNPKWLVGFSDISALHAVFARHGIVSLHGPMARYIGAENGCNEDFLTLCSILRGENPVYHITPHPFNRSGIAMAPLSGGNLAVLSALIGTRFDRLLPSTILFLEDIAEPIYKVERILWQLRLSGVLGRLAGLIVGDFTDYRSDANYQTMEEMIRYMVSPYDYPVAFGFPSGHGGRSLPLQLSLMTQLTVTPQGTVLEPIR